MAPVHRPDVDAFYSWRESEGRRDAGTKYKDYYMWPHINQEDLSDTRALLLLLNARGRNPPSAFAGADIDVIHFGMAGRVINPIFLNGHVIMLNGFTENTHEYGKLLSCDDDPDASDWYCTQKQFMPGEGLLVLEAQGKLLAFLEKCCRLILLDFPEETIVSNLFPVQTEPPRKSENAITGFDSLAVMAAEAPYRVPARLDLDRIHSLLQAQASAAEDHLWSLRENPGYFASMVLDAKEHRQEMIKDWHENAHPILNPSRQHTLLARILSSVAFEAYLDV
jgi:hypothetical protein